MIVAIFKRMQLFSVGFSAAVCGCMGAAMMAGETSAVSTTHWVQDRSLAYVDTNPEDVDHYIAQYGPQSAYTVAGSQPRTNAQPVVAQVSRLVVVKDFRIQAMRLDETRLAGLR